MAGVPFQCTWAAPRGTGHYNYRRDPAFMVEECTASVSTAGMPSAADVARCNGVPPVAIPYMTLQNLSRPDGTGKRVIVPMVTGFESTFLANSLQGLLCLPGCESVFMGEPISSDPAGRYTPQRDDDAVVNANEEETAGISMDEGDAQSAHSTPAPHQRHPLSFASSPSSSRSPSTAASDTNSLGPFTEMDATTNAGGDANADPLSRHNPRVGGEKSPRNAGSFAGADTGSSGRATRVLRGGIRCHGSARMKTAVSRAYADFVLQHLEEGEIQLKTPAPRSTSHEVVTDQQLDEAGELETLRGQTPNVPRCLAPVQLPEERLRRYGVGSGAGIGAAGGRQQPVAALGALSPPVSTESPTTVDAPLPRCAANANTFAVVPPINDAEKTLLTTSEHSCSDNSPTPSSGDGYDDCIGVHSSEERERGSDGDSLPPTHEHDHHAHGGVAETRVGVRHGAHDGRRFTCFASNSVANMPVYQLPRLATEDLVELTAFMVVRSSVQPDEAVDLDLATHILGDAHNVARLPPEVRVALVNRAARLMEAAVFLQI